MASERRFRASRRSSAKSAAASQHPSNGIKEVSLAVTQTDEVMQQNATLVEENVATAASHADDAQRLSE
ncbi:hypothetical protein [Paraburkholderia bengalensis]|uniref:hypothetical protein n=1 Tax=Paraburkholderia bengalensis TaxID=2747562 RepID=UPI0030143131